MPTPPDRRIASHGPGPAAHIFRTVAWVVAPPVFSLVGLAGFISVAAGQPTAGRDEAQPKEYENSLNIRMIRVPAG